jgi:hypothetical protein
MRQNPHHGSRRRSSKVWTARLLIATMPLSGCTPYPQFSAPYPTGYYGFAPPLGSTGRLAYRPYPNMSPAPGTSVPVAPNSPIANDLLAGGVGYVLGRAQAPGLAAATSEGVDVATASATTVEVATGTDLVAASETTGAVLTATEATTGAEALGAGELIEAGAAASLGEVLVGAAVIGGAIYLGSQLLQPHPDDHSQK